jgi:hypothetical protein
LSKPCLINPLKEQGTVCSATHKKRKSNTNNTFWAFMAMVVNCTAGVECKTQWIDVVVAAAEKYLGVQYFTAEL